VSDSRALLDRATRRLAATGVDSPRLDARLLWEHAVSAYPLLEGGAKSASLGRLAFPQGEGGAIALFENFIARRCLREPLAYITGHKEFWSLDFEVGPGVLIPRPETETIIDQAIALLPDRSAPLKVLDLGTGSGCLLVAFLKEFPNARGLGIDNSEKARRYAAANIARHGLGERAEIRAGNWHEGIDGTWDAILSNPPYIPTNELSGLAPEVGFEPVEALDGGLDGLASIRHVGDAMVRLLAGVGLTEIGAGQGEDAAAVMTGTGLVVTRTALDLAGIPRVVVTRPAG